MAKRLGQKLGSLFGLTLFGFILFLGFYHFSRQFAADLSVHRLTGRTDRPSSLGNEVQPSEKSSGKFVFHLNQARSIGKVDLVFRGLAGKTVLLIDVVIPELDPKRPYRHKLDVAAARRGFRIAGHDFQLKTVQENYIQLIEMSPGDK